MTLIPRSSIVFHPGAVPLSQMIRAAIREHTGVEPPPREPPPRIAAYGQVNLAQTASLLANVHRLAGGRAVDADLPDIMEQYGQR